jgi:hypothetical protein
VDDEREVVEAERLDERVEVTLVVLVGVGDVRLTGLAHADEVDRDRAIVVRDVWNDVPPQVRRGGVAVDEEDRRPLTLVDVVHARSEHLDVTGLEGEVGGDRLTALSRWLLTGGGRREKGQRGQRPECPRQVHPSHPASRPHPAGTKLALATAIRLRPSTLVWP